VHCQCSNALSGNRVADSFCEGVGEPLVHSHDHCVGPYTKDGFRFGDYVVTAAYLTEAFTPAGKATYAECWQVQVGGPGPTEMSRSRRPGRCSARSIALAGATVTLPWSARSLEAQGCIVSAAML